MKEIIQKFRSIIRFMATIFASREFAFVYCLIGTAAQVAHTYFLTSSISSFTGWFGVIQATGVSFFISSSLLFFISISDGTTSKENRRITWAINIFMIIEILINIYYYSRHLLIDSKHIQIFELHQEAE